MDVTALRKGLNLTQEQFAERIGVSPGHIGDLERGRRKLTLRLAARIEAATGAKGVVKAVVAEKTQSAA